MQARHFGRRRAYLVNALQTRAESAVHTEDATIDNRPEREVVKDFAAPPPDVAAAVLALTLVVEAVDLGDLARLVVAADEGHAFRVSNLERKEKEKCLDAVETAVDEVTWGESGHTHPSNTD